MNRICIDVLHVVTVDLHEWVFEDFASCDAFFWLLVEQLGDERSS